MSTTFTTVTIQTLDKTTNNTTTNTINVWTKADIRAVTKLLESTVKNG